MSSYFLAGRFEEQVRAFAALGPTPRTPGMLVELRELLEELTG